MNSTFVDSIRRLYKAGKVTLEYVKGLLASGKITEAEYNYIVA